MIVEHGLVRPARGPDVLLQLRLPDNEQAVEVPAILLAGVLQTC